MAAAKDYWALVDPGSHFTFFYLAIGNFVIICCSF